MTMQDGEKWERHESWGLAGLARMSGTTRDLFATELVHHDTVRLRIHTAQRERDLNRDFIMGDALLIEVEFSPNQFASFITTMNIGDGVPCTIRYANRKNVKGRSEVPRTALFDAELQETARKPIARLNDLANEIEAMGLPKGKTATILEAIRMARQEIESNLPFVLTQHREAMDDTVTEAKAAVEAFITGAIHRTGLKALQNAAPELLLTGKTQEEETRVQEEGANDSADSTGSGTPTDSGAGDQSR